MLTARRIALAGFPLVFLLLAGAVGALVADHVAARRDTGRRRCVSRVETTLDRAAALLLQAAQEHRRRRAAAEDLHALRAGRVAGDAAAVLLPALARLDQEARRPAAESFFAGLSALLAAEAEGEPARAAPSPVPAISEHRAALTRLLPDGGGVLAIRTAEGETLWRVRDVRPQQALAPAVRRELSFDWHGQTRRWQVEVALPAPAPPAPVEPRAVLAADPVLARLLDSGVALMLRDPGGTTRLRLPADPPSPVLAAASAPGWSTVPALEAEAPDWQAYSDGRNLDLAEPLHLWAAAAVPERAAAEEALSVLEASPLAAALLGLGALLTLAAVVASLRARPAAAAPRGPRLVRRGAREVPEDAAVLLAEFGGAEAEPADAPASRLPSPDRESNVVRLRALYRGPAEQGMDLQPRVRSEVLRLLLQEVGGERQAPPREER